VSDRLAGARAEITATDLELLAALNRRVEIVRGLHDYKLSEGIPLRDPRREDELVAALEAANGGPLSAPAVARFFRFVLELTREEVHGA
jgi:chorismate mutase